MIKNYTILLFDSIHYIIEYSKKYNVPIRNREQLVIMSKRIHKLMGEIKPSASDESLHDDESTIRSSLIIHAEFISNFFFLIYFKGTQVIRETMQLTTDNSAVVSY